MADQKQEFEELDQPFTEADLTADPLDLFRHWYDDATQRQPADWLMSNAMTLATVDAAGQPHARIVLLKEITDRGIIFYTNYDSDKGQQLKHSPQAAATFHWPHRYRQVRCEGVAEKTSRERSLAYFHSRPRGSQIGAAASAQSQPLSSRAELERQRDELITQWEGQEIPLPVHWGGFEIVLTSIEFWQSRHDRLHDRFRYQRIDGGWNVQRLSP